MIFRRILNWDEYCLDSVVHICLDPKTGRVGRMEMCNHPILDHDQPETREIHKEDVAKVRDFLDKELFWFNQTQPHCGELRRRQRELINQFGEMLKRLY